MVLVSALVEDTNGTLNLLIELYSTVSVVGILLKTGIRKELVFDVVRTLAFTSIGIVLFYVLAVLFGAPLLRSAELTARFALMLSLMTVAPASVILKSDSNKWLSLCILGRPRSRLEIILILSVLGAVVGSWLGAFVIPLDWERPWQVWPISCVVGAVIGHLTGCAVGIMVALKCYSSDRAKLQ